MKRRFSLKIGDIILMSVILLTSVLLFLAPFLKEKSQSAEIYIAETDETKIISLDTDKEYEIVSRGVKLTLCVKGGEISVTKSDCRDGICEDTPPISRKGQTIVCAPAGVIVRIAGKGAGVDGIAG